MDANKLKGKIVERGYNLTGFAKAMNMHYNTFFRKVSGESPFTIEEAILMRELLDLSGAEAAEIFLTRKS